MDGVRNPSWLFANGKVTHVFVYFDSAELMRELGNETIPHAR